MSWGTVNAGGSVTSKLPNFTYTGTYLLINDGNKNWRIKFLTSGTLVMEESISVDAFLVGGGAGGASTGNTNAIYGARGGGAGYTYKNSATLVAGTEYQIAIGAGGAAAATQTTSGNTEIHGGNGGATSAFGYSASGGYGNAHGGSGGAGSNGSPGTDGGNGTGFNAGTGQGTTTREFGESTGALYATGGRNAASTEIGDASTGDGGYGGYFKKAGANGRSGIVVIRNHREAVEETVIQNINSAISTHNANTSAHADKEKTSNKVTSISSASTDVQYPSAKCIYDAIATVTADDFNHNDLANKQGGSAGEYYHTTQAQNAALHAHSNKAALDAVSGTNTGDQDLSSYAKASDLHEHANKSVLDLVSGTNTGDQDLSSYAKTIDLHSHANKTALDNVSGINTGDQVLPTRDSLGLDTNDVVTFANLSGTNTGDQTLPTRDSLGLDTDDTVTFANLSGMNTGDQDAAGVANTPAGNIAAVTVQAAINELDAEKEAVANKVTSISETSTDTQYPSAKCTYGAISTHNNDAGAHASLFAAIRADIALRHALHYTFRWDKVNAKGVRLNNAQGISTTITNFCHRETVNAAMDNPFDSIYPWKDRNVCNISIDAYRALSSGASLRDCVISWLGDPDFDYAHVNGAWVYTPEFWYKVWDEGGYRYFDISPIAITGYVHAPETIEGRWFGGIYALTVDGTSKSCLLPKPGMPGKNVKVSTLHTYANNWGASVEDIYSYSATDVLMIVEFATMNTQDAIGNGVSDLYRQSSDTIQAAATASATVKVLTAAATNCIAGSIFDIGTTNGAANIGSFIIASTALDADPTYTIVTLTTDGSTPASVTVTTDHMWSVHGLGNTVDASIGAGSGYIGTNGKSHAYYRGQVAHANLFRYILGAYRQTATGKIWIANNSAEADGYDALNTDVHKDTGLTLPQGADGAAIGDYIGSLHLCPDVPAAPFCETIGGSNANPVGDYCYVPTIATGNTILIAGGHAYNGSHCGRFYGAWNYSAANSSWRYGAVPVLKSP